MASNKRENPEQIPKEDDPQGKTGKVISEQTGVEGQRKEVNVESYSKVADVGHILKNVTFPASKEKIIEHLKRQANIQDKEEILAEFEQKLKNREYKNVSDVTTTAGLVY
jgi:phage-related baseplate assembly protein